jgi:cytosine/adenosine deaminase-related metal-dependent hydrolase
MKVLISGYAVLAALVVAGTTFVASSSRAADEAAEAQSERRIRVIVTLKGLEAGPAWAERIAQARERVLRALAGHHVEINRQYDLVPALALTVDDEGLRILRSHPDVAGVAEEGTSTPGGGASATGTGK